MVARLTTFEEIEARAQQALTPWSGTLELTYRCNERCAMCYLGPDWGKGGKHEELSTEEIKDLLQQLWEAGCFELLITGGEVLLRRDFIEILDFAGELGFLMIVKTNGTRVNEEVCQALARNPVKRVDLSLLGGTAETHDAVTLIPGSFDRTVQAIAMLRAHGMPVQINFTAMTLNFRELAAARKLTKDLGAEFNWSSQVEPRDDRSVIPLNFRLPVKEQAEMQKLRVAETWEDARAAGLDQYPEAGYQTEGWFCQAGHSSFNITPYGEVQPCIAMRMDCGNIREQKFAEIWKNAPGFKRLRGSTIAEVYGCNNCAVRGYCNACPGLFYMEMGDILIPSPHVCEMAEMRYQAVTGVYQPCGARDEHGNLPTPENVVWGSIHEPIVRKAGKQRIQLQAEGPPVPAGTASDA